MRPIRIHTMSALTGVAAAGLVLLLMSAMQTTGPGPRLAFQGFQFKINTPIQVEGIPTPQQMLRVVEGVPLTVPANKVFVVTGLGDIADVSGVAVLFLDGVAVLSSRPQTSSSNSATSVRPVPTGLTAAEGVIISVTGPNIGQVFGYLVDK